GRGEDPPRRVERHPRGLGGAASAPGHRHRDRLEAGAGAGRAGDLAHEALRALAARVGLRLAMPALDVGAYPLEAGVVGPLAPVAVAVAHVHLGRVAVEDGALRLRRQLAPRGVEVEPELLPQRAEQP